MSAELVLHDRGNCSFCGKDRRITRGLVGTADQPVCICSHCLVLCCEILAEKARPPEPTVHDWSCSLCGESRVLELISGPRVFICDACVAAAAGLLT